MRKLKILQVINVRWFNAEADYCIKLSRSLRLLGMDVSIMGIPDSPVIKMAVAENFTTITDIDLNSQNPVAMFDAYSKMKKLLTAEKFDIVNHHRSEGFIIGAKACKDVNIKVVRTRGDVRPVKKGFFNKFLYNDMTDYIIASGDVIKRDMMERLGISEEKIKTVYTAVDTDYFSPKKRTDKLYDKFNIPLDHKIIAILGRLGDVKGHDLFLKAAKVVSKQYRHTKFLIIGSSVPNECEKIKDIIVEEELDNSVCMVLEKRDDIDEIVASVDIGIIASTGSEANCRVALEWLSSGIPTVSFATGVIPEVIRDGKDGYIVPVGDYNALAEKICELIGNIHKWDAFSASARENALERFDLKTLGYNTLEIYYKLAE